MLRLQLADELKKNVLLPLEQTRESASRALELDLMNDLAAAISQAKTAEVKIRHAEHQYDGCPNQAYAFLFNITHEKYLIHTCQ